MNQNNYRIKDPIQPITLHSKGYHTINIMIMKNKNNGLVVVFARNPVSLYQLNFFLKVHNIDVYVYGNYMAIYSTACLFL